MQLALHKPKPLKTALLLTIIILATPAIQTTHATTTKTPPKAILEGTVTKDIIDLNNIWLYESDNGENKTLPYKRNGNITINVGNLHFRDAFINASVKGTITAGGQAQYLLDSNGIPYILLTTSNTTPTSDPAVTLVDTVDQSFDPSSYIFIIAKILYTDNLAYNHMSVKLTLIDTGGEDHQLVIYLYNVSGTDLIELTDSGSDSDTLIDDVFVHIKNLEAYKYYAFCLKLSDIFQKAGLNTELVKITKVEYNAKTQIDTTKSSTTIKVMFKVVQIVKNKVMLNGILLNDTSTISISADSFSSTGLTLIKIADAQIPFEYQVSPEDILKDPDKFTLEYRWIFSLPDDSTLSFSNTYANITIGDIPANNITLFTINGADYTDIIKNQEYYSWEITAGTQYLVTLKAEGIPEDIYDALIHRETPPSGGGLVVQIEWWIGALLIAIGSIFGSYGVWLVKKGKEMQRKAKSKYLSKK